MADTITVTYKVNEDGSLTKITKKANDAADATNKAGAAAGNYQKKQKGVGQAGLSSAKSFSKMTQGITGGLVPAYAALAANVFAITAAFGFFKRAADVKLLEEGQVSFAASTGFALQTVTTGLREASGGMLGFKEAAEAAAMGVAKGFSPEQLENLAVGARKVSQALGRGFEDSFDRLIRGASKAEPELLDELGITLKLADATEKYGQKIGKNAKELTAFERSQAVLLETQRQLDTQFGAMEGKTNPFVRLSKTFDDIVKAATQFLLPIFEGLARVISGSAVAAVAVFGAIGISIAKTMVPIDGLKKGFEEWSMSQEEAMAHAMNDQMDYRAELQKTKEAIEASKAKSVQSSAKALGPRKSKLITKAQEGKLTDPKEIGQLKAHLKKAESEFKRTGEVKKGIFKGADLAVMQSLKLSLNQMGASHTTFIQRRKMGFKSLALSAKVQFARMKAAGVGMTAAVGRGFMKMGGLMNKAMKMAGIIGMFMMIWEIGQQIMQAPMKIVMSILRGADMIVKGAMKGIGAIIDGIQNSANAFINLFISGLNEITDALPESLKEKLGIKDIKLLKTNTTEAADAMLLLTKSFSMADSFESSSWGLALQSFQDQRVAAAKAAEAYDELKDSIEETGKEITNIAEARVEFMATRVKSLNLALSEGTITNKEYAASIKALNISQEQQGATTLSTIKAGSKLRAVMAIEDEEKRKVAIKLLRLEFAELAKIVPRAGQALQDLDQEALDELEFSASQAHAGLAALKDGLRNLRGAVASGDLISAEQLLSSLGNTAGSTSERFKELYGDDSVAAEAAMKKYEDSFKFANTTASDFLDTIKKLRLEQESLAISQARSSMVGGEIGKRFKLDNDITAARLAREQAEAELKTKTTETGDSPEEVKLRQKIALLKINEQLAQQAKTETTMGSAMAATQQMIALQGEGTQAMLGPMIEQLSKLGPEGELIASVVNGAFVMQEAFSTAFEKMNAEGATTADKLVAGFELAAAALNTIQNVLAASAQARVAGIDKEIAAEKKRDGKSAGSVAKIAAMEKKKTAIQKKAFEVNKKMQMAQIAIATAAAMVSAAAAAASAAAGTGVAAPITFASVFAGIGGFIAALGAAQIAIVAGTSFQGGASAGGDASAGAASSVSVGSRKSSVDMAKSQGAGGELAYMRGGQGTGGPENFRPAFSGYKHRASGGYVVGEQGPELFMPDTPGQIVPSGQGESTPINATINISAVDSAGVQDVLINQRGHIISMIREAANAQGDGFLENINVSEL